MQGKYRIQYKQESSVLFVLPAEGGGRETCGVRGRYDKQAPECNLAKGVVRGDEQGLAAGVVLHHRTPRHQMGGGACFQIRTPREADLLDQKGSELGVYN